MDKNNVKIKKAKITSEGFLKVEFTETIKDGSIEHTQEGNVKVHSDLILSFKTLAHHIASLTEQYDAKGKLSEEIVARGFSLKGEDEKNGIVMTGIRTLKSGKVIILNTPFTKWEQPEEGEGYVDIDELHQRINTCVDEVNEYLFNNKHQPDPQLSLDLAQ